MSTAMVPLRQLQGESPAIAGVREQVNRLLRSAAGPNRRLPPILILGETGTGKGLLAGAIHRASARAAGPFVDVNCAAIPETLLEAELFGFERGAFTDARQAKAGLFQTASGGTLFLDEVGLIPLAVQSKLLKAIEERSVRRLGSTRSETVDVTVIAATSEDVPAAVRAGRFRPDLYHRLAVVTLALPPLRRRGADVLLLAQHFLARICEEYGLPAKGLGKDARDTLLAHDWPGNVRELANVLERAALLTEETLLRTRHLGLDAQPAALTAARTDSASAESAGSEDERQQLLGVLDDTAWNFTRAAVRLGIPRNTLRYRIEKLGLSPGPPATRRRGGRPPRPLVPTATGASPAPSPPSPARRRVTLLEAQLVEQDGGTLGDRDRALDAIGEKVRAFGARVHEVSETRLLALFGLEPEEDAPVRAAHAAIALQKLASRARAEDAHRPRLAVGLHTAPLDVTDAAAPADDGRDAWHDATRTVRAVVDAVEPGTIVATAAAARFIGTRFDVTPLPTGAGPGAVLVVRHAETGRTRFVGRERELRLLTERFELAEAGQGQVVVIVGDPGIGKSRLLHEFRRSLGSRATWIEGHALAFARSTPFHAIIDMLRRVFRIDDADPEAVVIEKIDRGVARVAPDQRSVLPFIRYLLSVGQGDPAVAAMDPVQRHAAILGATQLLLERGAVLRTHVIALEDLHWTDAATEDWITRLADTVAAKRVLLLATARPGYRSPFGGRSFHTGLALATLSRAETGEIARALAGVDALPDELQALVDKAEGNPFFVEELMRAVHELARVRQSGGEGRLPDGSLAASEVPDTIEEVLLARIQRLEPSVRRLLGVAAVIGKNVPFALLRAVTRLPEDTLTVDVRRLLAAEFLVETRLYPEVELAFKHALTHDVAYSAVPPDERRTLHATIVDVIDTLYKERLHEHVERLAHHAHRGERWIQAAQYCRDAGQKAFDRSANREAVAFWEAALTAMARGPTEASVESAIDTRLALRSALLQLGHIRRIPRYLREAEALATAAGDRRRLAWARTYITITHLFVGEPRAAVAVGEQAVALVDTTGDAGLRATARTPLGHAYREIGDYRRAIALFDEAIAALTGDLLRQRLGQGMPPALYARSMAAICHAELGAFADADRLAGESERLAVSLDLPFGLALASIARAYAHLLQDRVADAGAIVGRALDVVAARDVPLWFPWAAAIRGYSLALSGDVADGTRWLGQALARAATLPFLFGQSQWLAWLAHARLLAGDAGEAAQLADEALELSRRRGERGYEAWALRVQLETGPSWEVGREALALAEDLGMRPLAARCHMSLATRHERSGDVVRAVEHATEAMERFTALGMPENAGGARALVGALSVKLAKGRSSR
jgi:DNA-binding NtrC family response regulator/tetratricopeptide (TPR) repeat protein